MEIQLIRNATMRIHCGPVCFVTDPLLAPKLTMKSYAGKSPNPLVDLPISAEKVLSGAEFVLLSHIHSDHFDSTAQQTISKTTAIYCQPSDLKRLGELGLTNVQPIETEVFYKGIHLIRTKGSHGQGAVLERMGSVSGFIFSTREEPTVYWVGDSILDQDIYETIDRFKPDVIITHSGGAVSGSNKDLIIMDADQTVEICRYAPKSTTIAVHLEALDHLTVTRADLVKARDKAKIPSEKLIIPKDGEKITIKKSR